MGWLSRQERRPPHAAPTRCVVTEQVHCGEPRIQARPVHRALASDLGECVVDSKRGGRMIRLLKTRGYKRQSLWFTGDMRDELREEAQRIGRSYSWLIQTAWMLARNRLRASRSLAQELEIELQREEFLERSRREALKRRARS
jgi:uncharacterized small protein (TIGR04563 family)